MPNYVFKCPCCGAEKTKWYGIMEHPKVVCTCKKEMFTKIQPLGGINFKGAGFYSTGG